MSSGGFEAPVVLDRTVKASELVVREEERGDLFFDPAGMAQGYRVAQALAKSKVVPEHFRNDPDSVFVVLHMARQRREDPLMLLQNMYLVKGNPGWKTEYLIARVRQSGVDLRWSVEQLDPPLIHGKFQNVRVTCFDKADPTRATTIDTAQAFRNRWTTSDKYEHDAGRMLMWRTASWWVSLYAPEIKHGLPTVEELRDDEPTPDGRAAMRATEPVTETRGPAALRAALGNQPGQEERTVIPWGTADGGTVWVGEAESAAQHAARVVDQAISHHEPDPDAPVPDPAEQERRDLYAEVLALQEELGTDRTEEARSKVNPQIRRLSRDIPLNKLSAYHEALLAVQRSARAQSTAATVGPPTSGWTDPGQPEGDDLKSAVADTIDEAKAAGVDVAAVMRELRIPAVDGAPEPWLRRLIHELLSRTGV